MWLNLVVVALLSFFWLQESVTLWKIIGVTMGASAVLSLGRIPTGNSPSTHVTSVGIALLITACILRAFMGILYKLASMHDIPMYELLVINGAIWGVGGLLYALISREALHLNARMTGFAGVSGLLVCGITYFMLAATHIADASIVIPITQMSFVVTCVLGATLHNEYFNAPKLFATAAAVGCVVCLAQR